MKFNKKNILFILSFIFVSCFSVDCVYADCVYSFTDHHSNSGTLNVSLKGKNSVEVKFDGSGAHYCGTGCDSDSLATFTIEDSKLYCPKKAYFCYDGGKNMLVDSPNKCIDNPATVSLSKYSGPDTEMYIPQENSNGIVLCSKGGINMANANDAKLKQYENQIASYLNTPPTDVSKINEISSGISSINDYAKYCNQNGFKEKKFDERLKTLNTQMTQVTETMYKNKSITDSDYSNTLSAINKAFSLGQISVATSDTIYDCKGLLDQDLQLIIEYALTTIQIVVPILLIIFVTIDFATVVISPGKRDEDAMKKAISRAIKRAIAAIAVFFIPLIVKLLLSWAGITDTCGL